MQDNRRIGAWGNASLDGLNELISSQLAIISNPSRISVLLSVHIVSSQLLSVQQCMVVGVQPPTQAMVPHLPSLELFTLQ